MNDQFGPDPAILAGTMVLRFARYWEGLRRGPALPRRTDLAPYDFKFCLPNVLVMDIERPFRVRYRLVGTAVVEISKLDFTNSYMDEIHFPNVKLDWTAVYKQVVATGRPVYGIVTIESDVGQRFFYEFGLFPLSSDGTAVDAAVAVEDYERVGDRSTRDCLLAQLQTPSRQTWIQARAS